ncbi:PQQ-dependent sugar dehydrogenase [Brevibacterium casei]|uniref:PQQ-dependent sugar dehydrogenase n=1 Tax=Brevibacterium casei TaxID=33889 RepID=UPI0039EE3418
MAPSSASPRPLISTTPPRTSTTPPRTGALSITRSRSGSTAPTRCAALATALILVLSACTTPDSDRGYGSESAPADGSTSADPTASAGAPDIAEPETVVEGLAAPWSIAFAGDVALVSERDSGRILELTETVPAQAREVGTVPGVAASGEGGLLGLATAEDFLYAYFTAAEDNRIVRFPLDGEPGSFALGSPEVLLDGIPKAGNHNGGRIAFGPDGKLYATAGDAGDRESAQNREALSGKILRLDPDGSVPEDNPFPGSPVYSFGHRNPQGIAWDETGRMFSSEFGQNTWDELNIIEAGGNYGWPDVEGMADPGEGSDFIDPVQQWSTGEASPSGMTITEGTILIANLRGEVLREVPVSDLSQSRTRYEGEYGRLRDVVTTPDGQLWMLTNNTDGRGSPAPGDDRILRIPLPD